LRGYPGKKDYVLGGNYESVEGEGVHKVRMLLVIHVEKSSDFGIYKCVARNALGSSEASIRISGE
jgi:hypothetical protein